MRITKPQAGLEPALFTRIIGPLYPLSYRGIFAALRSGKKSEGQRKEKRGEDEQPTAGLAPAPLGLRSVGVCRPARAGKRPDGKREEEGHGPAPGLHRKASIGGPNIAKKGALLPTCSAISFAVYVGKKYALKGSYRCARPREESPPHGCRASYAFAEGLLHRCPRTAYSQSYSNKIPPVLSRKFLAISRGLGPMAESR